MERWRGRVAFVTGASSGIGAETAKELVRQGLKVVAVARRVELIEGYEAELRGASGKLYPLKVDVSKEKDILDAFQWIKKHLGGVDIVINNAAVFIMVPLTEAGSTDHFRQIYNTNVIGLCVCSREAIKSMKERGVDDGHIININGVSGHYIVNFPGMYPASSSKHAVTALTEGLRRELVQEKSKIKVTSISPGLVDTELVRNPIEGIPPEIQQGFLNAPSLDVKDITAAILFVLGTPPHVQVHELIIRPVGEAM